MFADVLARNWGWVALRGLVALLFGLLTLFNPGLTLATLVLLFGAYAFVDGIFMVVGAIAKRADQPRWVAWLIGGLIGIAAGIVTFFMPSLTAAALLGVVAAWAILMGVAEIVAAIRLRKVITGEWALVLAGTLAVAFGILLIARPVAGALALVLWIGAYAIIAGVLLITLAFRVRNWGRHHPAEPMPHAA
jgi:uncharacterized membrane protein HdeD (DUF308 family)